MSGAAIPGVTGFGGGSAWPRASADRGRGWAAIASALAHLAVGLLVMMAVTRHGGREVGALPAGLGMEVVFQPAQGGAAAGEAAVDEAVPEMAVVAAVAEIPPTAPASVTALAVAPPLPPAVAPPPPAMAPGPALPVQPVAAPRMPPAFTDVPQAAELHPPPLLADAIPMLSPPEVVPRPPDVVAEQRPSPTPSAPSMATPAVPTPAATPRVTPAPRPASPRPAVARPAPHPGGANPGPAQPARATEAGPATPPSQAGAALAAGPPLITAPRFRRAPQPPDYPARAVELDLTGTVVIRALLNPEGDPREVRVHRSSGQNMLDSAAAAAVRRWAFEPASRDGQRIEAWVEVPVHFRLN